MKDEIRGAITIVPWASAASSGRQPFQDSQDRVAESVDESVEGAVRSMRIVVGGLLAGLAGLSALGIALAPILDPPDPNLGRLLFMGRAVMGVRRRGASNFARRLSMMR